MRKIEWVKSIAPLLIRVVDRQVSITMDELRSIDFRELPAGINLLVKGYPNTDTTLQLTRAGRKLRATITLGNADSSLTDENAKIKVMHTELLEATHLLKTEGHDCQATRGKSQIVMWTSLNQTGQAVLLSIAREFRIVSWRAEEIIEKLLERHRE